MSEGRKGSGGLLPGAAVAPAPQRRLPQAARGLRRAAPAARPPRPLQECSDPYPVTPSRAQNVNNNANTNQIQVGREGQAVGRLWERQISDGRSAARRARVFSLNPPPPSSPSSNPCLSLNPPSLCLPSTHPCLPLPSPSPQPLPPSAPPFPQNNNNQETISQQGLELGVIASNNNGAGGSGGGSVVEKKGSSQQGGSSGGGPAASSNALTTGGITQVRV